MARSSRACSGRLLRLDTRIPSRNDRSGLRVEHGYRNWTNYRTPLLLHCGVSWPTILIHRTGGAVPGSCREATSLFTVLFAYVDESGDPAGDPAQRGSPSYTLGVVLVPALAWPDTFDALINLRRQINRSFAVPARAEIKASYLIRNEGVFETLRLSSQQRNYIYRQHLMILGRAGARAFAVFVDKRSLASKGRLDQTRDLAWEALFQRLSRIHDRDVAGQKTPIMLVHDEGEDLTIRKLARRARRYLTSGSAYGTGSLKLSARWLLDDPVSRQSHHSLFVQCADLVAYAATKRIIPGGRRQTHVCPPSTWERIGAALHAPANYLAVKKDPSVPVAIVVRD